MAYLGIASSKVAESGVGGCSPLPDIGTVTGTNSYPRRLAGQPR
jgi:hypothetical protein